MKSDQEKLEEQEEDNSKVFFSGKNVLRRENRKIFQQKREINVRKLLHK